MSSYGSQKGLNSLPRRSTSRSDVTGGNYPYARSVEIQGGNGYGGEYAGGYNTISYHKTSGGGGYGGSYQVSPVHQRASLLQQQCQDYLNKAEMILQSGADAGRVMMETEKYMAMSTDVIHQLKGCAMELRQIGQPNESIVRSVEVFQDQLRAIHYAMNGTTVRKKSSLGWEDPGPSFHDAMGWIGQQKRLIETSSWGDTSDVIDQQLVSHSKFHSTIQRSPEVDKARDELIQKGDKAALNALEQEWDSLQKLSFTRTSQLRDLQKIIEEISREIMWVNEREEEELMFNWGDKNIDDYIPKKQESYSKLMSDLEEKEKQLNKLKHKVDGLLKNNHPASDKIEAYMDTLQTQWSWLLQITKCIQVHLKENAAYSQFFKEAHETHSKLLKEHENVRKKFTCDKTTPLETLQEMVKNLEKEKERIIENKRQVQHLVNKSKSIVRLRPRNPEEKNTGATLVKALCDYMQDQKGIYKDNEGILKDNSERSKWQVMGPGGLEMTIPSVCLLIPPPNPLSISLANKNEQYYDAILGIWNQLYINIKSLISWQLCLKDIEYINSLTITMISKMRPEEYRKIIKNMETHFQEFQRHSKGSDLFVEDDKQLIETQFTGAQTHYDDLVVHLPAFKPPGVKEDEVKEKEAPVVKEVPRPDLKLTLLTELQLLRQRLEAAEDNVSQHPQMPMGEDGLLACSQRLLRLDSIEQDVDSIRDDYLKLKEKILKKLEGIPDPDKVKYLRMELNLINQKLGSLEGFSSSHTERMKKQMTLLQALMQGEDVIKVYEARLTEKETTSLDPDEVEEYMTTLKLMKSELEQKSRIMGKMETELSSCVGFNSLEGHSCPKCELELSKYTELVGQMSDRWLRIHGQIDSRLVDMENYLLELKQYRDSSSSLNGWIDTTRQRQDALQGAKFEDEAVLTEHITQQKALNSEIKVKRGDVEDVFKDGSTCASTIKDCELQLASYSSGLETLLNIPIKRTMLQSPATIITEEASDLQARYVGLLTSSNDYGKFLAEMLKYMQELKIRNTRIELLEEQLRILQEEMEEQNQKNKSLEALLAKFQKELTESKDQLLSMEEVKRTHDLECHAARDNLSATSNQIAELNDKLARLNQLLEEEQRKKKLLEETYKYHQEEYEVIIRKRQKELEEVNCAKIDVENTVRDKDREIERLRMQLENEASRLRELESELSKASKKMQESQGRYDLILKERDSLLLKMKQLEQDQAKRKKNDEELNRIKVTLESELRLKKSLQEENNKIRKDFEHWKAQYELKEKLVKQYESEKGTLHKEKTSLTMEIERLLSELKLVEERYKVKMKSTETEMKDLASLRDSLQAELRKLKQRPNVYNKQTQTEMDTVDGSTLLFDGIRRKVTAHQLHDCGIIDKATLGQLLKGKKTVEEVALDIKLYLKGTGTIAGMGGPEGKMSFTEAKNKDVLTPQCASRLLEAQAATGFIIDPKENKKMPVDVAVTKHLVDFQDRDLLLTAENACTGFKDPSTGKLLSAGQAMKKGWIDLETTLRLLQAQESVGGIIDPVLSVFLTKDGALDRDLIDQELYSALNKRPRCYIEPVTQEDASYIDLKKKCRTDSATGLLLLSAPQKPIMVKGLRREVSVNELVDSRLLEPSDVDNLRAGKISSEDIQIRLRQYLRGSACIAGIYDEASGRTLPIYQAMKDELLRPGTTLELLEAQAAAGFMLDPVNNLYLTVEEAVQKGLVGKEYKDKLLSAERAVTGYTDPASGKPISLFQAIDIGLIEKGHGIRLLEAQIASGGIIDPKFSHRIDVDVAYQRGYFDKEMSSILISEDDDTKGFFDPNTQENLTYLQLKNRCITDKKTGLVLLPLLDKKKRQSTQKNTLRKRRVVIVDPDTNKEMTVKEAYDKDLIDYETYIELSEQECEWEEITITDPDGSIRYVVIDRKTGIQYDIDDCLEQGLIDQATFEKYRSKVINLTQFMDILTKKARSVTSSTSTETSISSSTLRSAPPQPAGSAQPAGSRQPAGSTQQASSTKCTTTTQSTTTVQRTSTTQRTSTSKYISTAQVDSAALPGSTQIEPPLSPNSLKHIASISIILASPTEVLDEQVPIGAIFDADNLEKITIMEALHRGILDTITAQRLLEAQACTGGIIDHNTGKRFSVQEAARQGIIDDDMATKLKPAQKAFFGFEDVKTKRKMSAVEAIKERWLPYGAGQRFLEFQYVTGGLFDPEIQKRRTLQDVVQKGWLDSRGAQKLQDTRHHSKNLTCPKTKLKISYKEAMDNCMEEEDSGLKMLHATSMSSKGISSPYNVSSAPGSRSGSRPGSRRGSVDLSSKYSFSYSFSSRSAC
ncbi:desmoplakin-A-like isoform X2 [Conger conger]|uniref:desmoplakin-A-like isoform X2 n=1 Tax=Conger conger TaxID=82655 RepID=UPI002A5A3CBC|nr:desmoplakin-A-like isoform X2 [Conger conger]